VRPSNAMPNRVPVTELCEKPLAQRDSGVAEEQLGSRSELFSQLESTGVDHVLGDDLVDETKALRLC
jgi:hypothetical protein